LPATIEHIRAGWLRVLGTRLEALPDVPTVADFVPGYEASQWFVIGLRTSTSAEIIDKLNSEINADPKMKARIADLGTTVFPGYAADLAKLVADETEKWGKVVKISSAKPE
jgi:tripartite-type tricarboxylate transporter receptor subunit TctC